MMLQGHGVWGDAAAMQRAVLLGDWAAVRRTRRSRAVCLGGIRQCGVVVREGGGAMDDPGVVGRGPQRLRGMRWCGGRCFGGRGDQYNGRCGGCGPRRWGGTWQCNGRCFLGGGGRGEGAMRQTTRSPVAAMGGWVAKGWTTQLWAAAFWVDAAVRDEGRW